MVIDMFPTVTLMRAGQQAGELYYMRVQEKRPTIVLIIFAQGRGLVGADLKEMHIKERRLGQS
jgi:hypothetical protein